MFKLNFSGFKFYKSMLSDYDGIIFDINNRKTFGKSPNIRKLNNILRNNK